MEREMSGAEATDALIVLTTLPIDADAAGLAEALVGERLAACVSVLPPMQSTYRWQGAVERAAERQVIVKTTRGRLDALRLRLGALHPYDVPELLVVAVAGGEAAYLAWLGASTAPPVNP